MKELEFDGPFIRGQKGQKIRLIQEWLGLHGYQIKIDGDFGPATEAAIKRFRSGARLKAGSDVDKATFEALVAPMRATLAQISSGGKSFGEMVVRYAKQHLAQHPREIGGDNRGPWVRLYMKGNEGPEWYWCAGFASFCLEQAARSLGAPRPIEMSFSCDWLAASAKAHKRFVKEPPATGRKAITPGSLFLVRRSANDWEHVGIVVSAAADVFHTIEGNTNDDGSRNGYEVCARVRGYKAKDFIVF